MAASSRLRRLGITALTAAAASTALLTRDTQLASSDSPSPLDAVRSRIAESNGLVPHRSVNESVLIGSSSSNPLDILVVGGGATGCGVALDATTRGLRVGLVEREDFSSGTSSRSTKLIHGEKGKDTLAPELNDVGATEMGQSLQEDEDGLQEMVRRWSSRTKTKPRYLEQYELSSKTKGRK